MYYTVDRIEGPVASVDADKRIPFGWNAVCVQAEPFEATRLIWAASQACSLPVDTLHFRITVALDVRDEKQVEVRSLQSSILLGLIDIRYAPVFQIFEVELSGLQADLAWREGISLQLVKGSAPLWLFAPGHAGQALEPVLLPHLFMRKSEETKLAAFEKRLHSLASLQQFGWMEGCVLDGLMDYGFQAAAEEHLQLFMNEEGQLIYEDPRSRPVDGQFYGIESLLPVAILAKIHPKHPVLEQAAQFMASKREADGAIRDGGELSAEGNYTIAYTLACLSNLSDSKTLADEAIKQLEVRKQRLWVEDELYLRYHTDHAHTFRHWGRAHVWYLLGMIRTIQELRQGNRLSDELSDYWQEEFNRAWRVAWSYRNEAGLWYSFIDDPASQVDSSASAGIAAAGAIAIRIGYLSASYHDELQVTLHALHTFITPDGLISGTSQANKGGERLQREGYRVISQVTMGLMAQLICALHKR
jgi:unsaturated rhamnogalacturonyl hydrolase